MFLVVFDMTVVPSIDKLPSKVVVDIDELFIVLTI